MHVSKTGWELYFIEKNQVGTISIKISQAGDTYIENKCMDTKGERGVGVEELGDGDWHIHTTNTMYKIDN